MLLTDLAKFESVSQKLQLSMGITLCDVRILFDKLLSGFNDIDSCSTHLRADANIVQSPQFENGIVKMLDGREIKMLTSEKKALPRFATQPQTSVA